MKYLLIISCLLGLSISSSQQIYSQEKIEVEKPIIISRQQWGANESYGLLNSPEWKAILEKRRKASQNMPKNIAFIEEKREKNKKINKYLNSFFSDQFNIVEKVYTNSKGQKYAWPLEYVDYIDSIVIHHTHSEYDNSFDGIRKIHKYHSLTRQWGDIGYNYLIGDDGEIFEGRAGGDYVAGAHSKYNNRHSVGISIIGNYDSRGINSKQYESLQKLIQYLIHKYGIDISKSVHYHSKCAGDACKIFPIETFKPKALAGHRDTGHTNCPGDKLYAQMQQIGKNSLFFSKGLEPVLRNNSTSHNIILEKKEPSLPNINKVIKILSKMPREKKVQIQKQLEKKIREKNSELMEKKLRIVKIALKISLNQKSPELNR